tara:strand:+ start:744 stop:1628 length:885 start_codon:yes stop_codon:yes gene_type:complete
MRESEKTDLLNKTLLQVHQELGPIIEQDSKNEGFKRGGVASKYSSIGAVLKKLKPIANKHGIIIEQYPKFLIKSTASVPDFVSGTTERKYKDTLPEEIKDSYQWTTDVVRKEEFSADAPALLTTRITHAESGQYKEIDYPVRVKDPTDPQKLKSGHTYARRDSIELFFNLAEADDDLDDDGNLAASAPANSANSANSSKGKTGSRTVSSRKKAYQPTDRVLEIQSQFESSTTKDELKARSAELQEIKKGSKTSEWDEIDEDGQNHLAFVWEQVEKKLPEELPKTEDEIKDDIPF